MAAERVPPPSGSLPWVIDDDDRTRRACILLFAACGALACVLAFATGFAWLFSLVFPGQGIWTAAAGAGGGSATLGGVYLALKRWVARRKGR